MKSIIIISLICIAHICQARSFEFKFLKGERMGKSKGTYTQVLAKRDRYEISISPSTKIDDMSEIEIRAATLLKDIKSKRSIVNDIAKITFLPDKKQRKFVVITGIATGLVDKSTYIGGDYSNGYIRGGVIIEMYQSGKCVKHWSSATGNIAKMPISDSTHCAYIDVRGYESSKISFDNETLIFDSNDIPPDYRY